MNDGGDQGRDRLYRELAGLIRDVRLFALAVFVVVLVFVAAMAVRTC